MFGPLCAGILATPPTSGVFSCRAYRVKQGQSLASIALLFETTIASLVAANPELVSERGGQRAGRLAGQPDRAGLRWLACGSRLHTNCLTPAPLPFALCPLPAPPGLQNEPSLLTPGKIVKIAPYPGECVNGLLIE